MARTMNYKIPALLPVLIAAITLGPTVLAAEHISQQISSNRAQPTQLQQQREHSQQQLASPQTLLVAMTKAQRKLTTTESNGAKADTINGNTQAVDTVKNIINSKTTIAEIQAKKTVTKAPAKAPQALEYEYDKLSRLTRAVLPNRQLEINYVYDAMGNRLVRRTDTLSDEVVSENHSFSVVQPANLQAAPFQNLTLAWDHGAPQGWRGHYSVYLGETYPPSLYKSGLTEKSLHISALDYAQSAFLQIKVIDRRGNVHTSPIWTLSPLDTDNDAIPDHIESRLCTDMQNPDTDNDGLLDGLEDKPIFGVIYPQETDPCNSDTDGDLIPDGWELNNSLNPLDAGDADSDTDGDSFSALAEYLSDTDPSRFDSAPVGIELNFEGASLPEVLSWIDEGDQPWRLDQSEPLQGAQSLKSGTLGNYQSSVIKTHVLSTGGMVRFDLKLSPSFSGVLQFYLDDQLLQTWQGNENGVHQTTVVFDIPAGAHELKWRYYTYYRYDNSDHTAWIDRLFISAEEDSDADTVADSWELRYFSHLDEDLSQDSDKDGLTHLQEYEVRTAPDNADTDGDLISDGWEVSNSLEPLDNADSTSDIDGNGQSNLLDYFLSIPTQSANADSDEDRISDLWEAQYGLNPLDAGDATSDTDGDGFSALAEYLSDTDPSRFDSVPVGIELNFEGASLPEALSWIDEGDQPWRLDQSEPLQGAQSLKSGTLGRRQSSVIKTHVLSTGGMVRFDLKLSPSHSYNRLQFYLDDQLLQTWQSNRNGVPQTTVVFDLPAGAHELKWRSYKNYQYRNNDHTAWIDRLFISAEEDSDADTVADSWELRYFSHLDEDLSQDSDKDGLTHLQEYEVRTAPDNADTDGDLISDGWEVSNSLDPLDNADSTSDIDGNGQSNLLDYFLSIPTQSANADSDEDRISDLWEAQYGLNPLDAGDATSDTDGDGFSALAEYLSDTDPSRFDSAPVGIELNFEGASLPEALSWIDEGDQPWRLDQSEPLQGAQSLKSGTLGNYQSSVIKTHVLSTGGMVRFDLKLSPSYSGVLKFYLDDQLLQTWQGNWNGVPQTTVVFDLPAGAHELKWRSWRSYKYEYDNSDHTAWIDRLFISAEEDSDADTVADSWELRYFSHLDEDLSQDSDGDGFSALQEYRSGTDPNQSKSAPTSVGVNRPSGIKGDKTIGDRPFASAATIVSRDFSASRQSTHKSNNYSEYNFLYAGVTDTWLNYLQRSDP